MSKVEDKLIEISRMTTFPNVRKIFEQLERDSISGDTDAIEMIAVMERFHKLCVLLDSME